MVVASVVMALSAATARLAGVPHQIVRAHGCQNGQTLRGHNRRSAVCIAPLSRSTVNTKTHDKKFTGTHAAEFRQCAAVRAVFDGGTTPQKCRSNRPPPARVFCLRARVRACFYAAHAAAPLVLFCMRVSSYTLAT